MCAYTDICKIINIYIYIHIRSYQYITYLHLWRHSIYCTYLIYSYLVNVYRVYRSWKLLLGLDLPQTWTSPYSVAQTPVRETRWRRFKKGWRWRKTVEIIRNHCRKKHDISRNWGCYWYYCTRKMIEPCWTASKVGEKRRQSNGPPSTECEKVHSSNILYYIIL